MSVFGSYTPQFGGASPMEGWQTVEIVNVKEDTTQIGNDRLTVDVTGENGAEVKFAYSVIMGYEWSNKKLTELLLAFHCSLDAKNAFALKGKSGEVYLWKEQGLDGKAFWKIRNMRVPAYEGHPAYETWYKKPVSNEEAVYTPPVKPVIRGNAENYTPAPSDTFTDDVPF